MQSPKAPAASFLAAIALLAIIASSIWTEIWFGPALLLICACGAWFVGNRFAVLLGVFVTVIQILNGNSISSHIGTVQMAVQFCCALAVVLMLGVARAALEIEWRFARVDPLTGALNRKAFFEAVERKRNETGVAMIAFADVDGLKRLNDRLGHEAGDEALCDVADRIRKAVRSDDIFARIGGDEFVIFLTLPDTAAAESVAQRLNTALNHSPLAEDDRLKCSLGVLVLPAGSTSIDAELNQADRLMYHAKRECTGLSVAVLIDEEQIELVALSQASQTSDLPQAAMRSAGRSTARTGVGRTSDNTIAA